MITVPIGIAISFVVIQRWLTTNFYAAALLSPIPYSLFVYFSSFAPNRLKQDVARFIRTMKDVLWRNYQPTTFDFDEIIDGIFLGRMPRHEKDLALLKTSGIVALIVLNEEWELKMNLEEVRKQGFELLHLSTPDYFAPSPREIQEGVLYLKKCIEEKKKVYTHCFAGKGRSALIVLAYIISVKNWSISEANNYVRERRKVVVKFDNLYGLKYQSRMLQQWYDDYHVKKLVDKS